MDTLLTPWGILAVCMAVAAVALFGLASSLPSLFPPAFARFVGIATLGASVVLVWAISGAVWPPAALGGACFAAMVAIHLAQTRRPRAAQPDKPDRADEIEVTRYV